MQRRNMDIVDKSQTGMNLSFLLLLLLISITGFFLLALRKTPAMGILLLAHLSLVMTFFLTMPYGRFVHGIYRSGALLKWTLERSRQPKAKAAA
jgi:citrate/tricarballylate utilization protein